MSYGEEEWRADGAMVGRHVDRLWPGETVELAALALCEEAGEVARAVVKRHHGTRGTAEHWTEQLRQEVAQVVVVCMDIARREGFSLHGAVQEAIDHLVARSHTT